MLGQVAAVLTASSGDIHRRKAAKEKDRTTMRVYLRDESWLAKENPQMRRPLLPFPSAIKSVMNIRRSLSPLITNILLGARKHV